jgi:ribosome biogenesis GTPase A
MPQNNKDRDLIIDNSSVNIQWFPGHMKKALRMIEENLKLVDLVCEIIDARIPVSSRNPELDGIVGSKPRLIVLNRTDLADPNATKLWHLNFNKAGISVLETDSKSGRGVNGFSAAVREVLKDKIARNAEKGISKTMKCMVVGVPNVGKSTFINKVAKKKAANASDRPGVTRGKQWINVDNGLDLLDTPGVLWPKFDDPRIGENLAYTGAVKDAVVDTEALASRLMEKLNADYPQLLIARYKLADTADKKGWELLEAAARKRGFLISGGEADTERMSAILLDEFRGGVIGRTTLEKP